jgi:hypothetical protein
MGNCTPLRLTNLFQKVGLPAPFSADFGDCPDLKKAVGENRKLQAAKLAEHRLTDLMALRNDIAHGAPTISLSVDELRESIQLLCALTSAFRMLCEKKS